MPEISDAQLAELQGAYRILDAVMKNPETKQDAHKILKKLNPKVSIPEHDLKESVDSKIAKLTETMEKFIKDRSTQDETQKYQSEWDSAIKKFGITADGEKKMAELMEQRKIRDPHAGALLFNDLNPPAEPTTSAGWASSTLFDPSPDTDLGEWFKNPDKKRDSEIAAVLAGR